MSDLENFLARWSRRKRDVADVEKDASRQSAAETPATAKQDEAESDAAKPGTGDAETPFDLASLPSIESITADTDIRGFFAPGVPAELARAALRRAWAADPHIRDFVGLEDYAWDFNAPESIPGFGKLEMTDELRREVARIVGNLAPEAEPATSSTVPSAQPSDAAQELVGGPTSSEVTGQSIESTSEQNPEPRQHSDELIAPPDSDAAVQKETRLAESLQPAAKRSHGGALPK